MKLLSNYNGWLTRRSIENAFISTYRPAEMEGLRQ